MKNKLAQIKAAAQETLAATRDMDGLEQFRIQYLGKKGLLTGLMKQVGGLLPEERPLMGQLANQVKMEIQVLFDACRERLENASTDGAEGVDITLPGRTSLPLGHLHPITQVIREVSQIFTRMGFRVVKGPNVELDYYNFEALNIPKDHPARDMQDTFYISGNIVLRTHTSPIQIRVMEQQRPPVSIIAPGRVYRRDSDVSHTPMFHQVEGLLVDENVTFGDLKGTLTGFVHQMFGPDIALRFRPSFFPFTEPSAEVDIQCVICRGAGCRTCSQSGWLEVLGCGMVNPRVYGFVDVDPQKYTGFAFGMGIERLAMLKYGIDDIQLFYRNDMRFLRQF